MEKFQNMTKTAKGEDRASVRLNNLETLWFNTGTLCNLECKNCYIESSPTNDRLSYLTVDDVKSYLKEINEQDLKTKFIGLTGGEPFINPSIIGIIEEVLKADLEILILTNANRVLKRHRDALTKLKDQFGDKLHIRVSLDHFTPQLHDKERGAGAFERTMNELQWLYQNKFNLSIASRSLIDETQQDSVKGHSDALKKFDIDIELDQKLVIFPEMQSGKEVPEITTACWNILDKSPDDQMCATERMIVKRKGEKKPVIMPCTLLAYDDQFVLGNTLSDSKKDVFLNHKFCAEFCVLGGASCSSTK